MTKQELLSLMRLLSALESAMLCSKVSLPDYLLEGIGEHVAVIEREILK